jgi:hypothetical protein
MADPTNLHAIDDIKFLTGFNVEPVVASETAIAQAIERAYNVGPTYDDVLSEFADEDVGFSVEEDELNAMELEKASRGRARRPPLQRHPAQRDQGARERHPHRALREEAPGALPRRRRAARGDVSRRSS